MQTGRVVAIAAAVGAAGLGLWWLFRRRSEGAAAPTTTPQEVQALARAMMSEASREPKVIQTAIGYAVINESLRRDQTIWRLVRGSGDEWGRQGTGGRSYVSSAQVPTAEITTLAARVLAGDEADFSDGATNFDSPRAQRAALAKGVAGYTKTPEQVAENRIAGGMELVLIPGIAEERFRMWRYA